MVTFGLEGKNVIVVGASRGIGHAVARAFARERTNLVMAAEDDGIHAAAETISKEEGHPVLGVQCDITDRAQIAALVANLDRIDVLVNNAGIIDGTSVDDGSAAGSATFRRIVDVNLSSLQDVTVAAVPKMAEGGRIIFTASNWGLFAGVPGFSAYVASKHGVVGLVRTLAMELGGRGIAVNAVCPGTSNTPICEGIEEPMMNHILNLMHLTPYRMIEPSEIAGVYLFLASDAAGLITGQTVTADRGQSLGSNRLPG